MEPDPSSLPALPRLLLHQNQSFNFQAPGSWLSKLSIWRGWSHWEELRLLNEANMLNNESQELPPPTTRPQLTDVPPHAHMHTHVDMIQH